MPLDYDDLETDNSDGEKKVFEGRFLKFFFIIR